MSEKTALSQEVYAFLADRSDEKAGELRRLADAFDEATNKIGDGGDAVKRMLGCWARLRRAYCSESGKALI